MAAPIPLCRCPYKAALRNRKWSPRCPFSRGDSLFGTLLSSKPGKERGDSRLDHAGNTAGDPRPGPRSRCVWPPPPPRLATGLCEPCLGPPAHNPSPLAVQGKDPWRNPAPRPNKMSTPPLAGVGMPPGPFTGPQTQAAREVNTASLCRIGQETVQDIVFRTMEIFQLLRNMQLPNGVTYHTSTYQDRLGKLQEHLRQLSILFRKLRLVYDKCNENCAGLDPIPIEQLIPYVEEDSFKHDDRGAASQLLFASEERREIMEVNKKLKQKNQQLKQIMDQLRNLIWDINAMLAMRN